MLSVDMGLKGAMTAWSVNSKGIGTIKEVYRFQTTKRGIVGKRDIDYRKLYAKMAFYQPDIVVYEKQFVGKNQGYSKGIYGREGIIIGLALSLTPDIASITPLEWTTILSLTSDKQQHIALCNKYYPDINCTHDGIADSVLIGHAYLKRERLNKIYKS